MILHSGQTFNCRNKQDNTFLTVADKRLMHVDSALGFDQDGILSESPQFLQLKVCSLDKTPVEQIHH